MAFAADNLVLLVLVITAEFLSGFFSAKCLFLLRGTKPHGGCRNFDTKKYSPYLSLGIITFLFTYL